MKSKIAWFCQLTCLLYPVLAGASESTVCTVGTLSTLVTDGRIVHSNIPDSATFFWQFYGIKDRSYSIEMASDVDSLPPAVVTVYNTVDDCTTAVSTLTLNQNTGTDPVLLSAGIRRTFIAPNDGFYVIKMANGATGAHLYNIRVTDTTLYNSRWSTYSGFFTQWSFRNKTNSVINVTLTATSVAPAATPVTITFPVPAKGEVFTIIAAGGGDINVGKDHAGYAEAAHDGPAGGLSADAYFINPSGTVISPISFEPRNAMH